MRSALIIGCGYTGTALAERLLAGGASVIALSRGGEGPAGVLARAADLRDEAPLDLPPARGAVVYYLVPPLFRELEGDRRPHLGPMRRVLAALRSLGIARLVYLSSTSVYGDRGGEWVDEDSPPRPDSPWGTMRLDLEGLVLGFAEENQLPATVLRVPEIYGPGRGPVQRLREGYALLCPERWTNRIHRDDLVDVLLEVGERLAPASLLCGDAEPARAEEVYALAARLLGLPGVPVRTDPPSDPNRLALARDSKRCDSRRLRAWLGRPLRYPTFREGLPATV